MKEWIECTEELFTDVELYLSKGDYILHDQFDMEEALAAIDIGDPKMDRGLVLIEARRPPLFKKQFLKSFHTHVLAIPSPDMKLVDSFMDRIFELEACWLQGWSYADTLLTCFPLHQIITIEFPYLRLFCYSILRIHEVLSFLIQKSGVLREEDLHPNMHGVIDNIRSPDLELMLKDLENPEALKAAPAIIKNKLMYLMAWGKIVLCIKNHRNPIDYEFLYTQFNILLQLGAGSFGRSKFGPKELAICSKISNNYTCGCPRPVISYNDRQDCVTKQRNSIEALAKFCKQFIRNGNEYNDNNLYPLATNSNNQKTNDNHQRETSFKFPAYKDLLNQLVCMHADQVFTPFTRMITFHMILAPIEDNSKGRSGLLFDRIPQNKYFETESILMQNIFLDSIQLECHSWSRQHRLLHTLLPKLKQFKTEHQNLEWLYQRLEIFYILIGFGLDLYNNAEILQAIWLLDKKIGKGIFKDIWNQFKAPTSLLTDASFKHRWECILDNLTLELYEKDYDQKPQPDHQGFKISPELTFKFLLQQISTYHQ